MPIALFVAGGTGGHLYPGIATAKALLYENSTSSGKEEWKIAFVVRRGDRGKDILEREGFDVIELSGQGLPRRLSINLLTFPFMLVAGFINSLSLLNRIQPKVVIGMGGYLSFPVIAAAWIKRIPTMIHEQNVYPGLANRLLSRCVDSVAISFSESQAHFSKKSSAWLSGLPVRPDIGNVSSSEGKKKLGLAENKTTYLIFGGSQGAHHLNQTLIRVWPLLSEWNDQFQVMHVTGERDYKDLREVYRKAPMQSVVLPYCHEMAAALAASDLVICRAGASSVAELVEANCPAILVPFPFASENHQFYNAEVMVKYGGAELIAESEFTPTWCAERLRLLFRHPERLSQMRQRLAGLSKNLRLSESARRLALQIKSLSR